MEPYHSKVSALDSSEQLQLEKSNENESEDGGGFFFPTICL